jgi:hypothetical protein
MASEKRKNDILEILYDIRQRLKEEIKELSLDFPIVEENLQVGKIEPNLPQNH